MALSDDLARLLAEIIRQHFAEWPVKASFFGYGRGQSVQRAADGGSASAEASGQLGFFSRDARASRLARVTKQLARLKRFKLEHAALERAYDDAVDWELAASLLELECTIEQELNPAERDPTVYPKAVLYGLYWLLLSEAEAPIVRARCLLARLRQVPRVLDEGRRNLAREPEHIPALWVEVAREFAANGRRFIREQLGGVFAELPELESAATEAREAADQALAGFAAFCADHLVPRARGSVAIGEALFDRLLREKHFLPMTATDVEQTGLAWIANAREQLEALLAQTATGRTLQDALASLYADLVPPHELEALYAARTQAASEFCRERGLVTIPGDQECLVRLTPEFARVTTTYAAYQQPPAFGTRTTGYFWITPPPPGARRHPHVRAGVDLVCAHEAYPGHHLQYVRTNQVARPIRKLFKTSVFVEGWGLFVEEMLYREGFYQHEATRAFQLVAVLRRACRCVIDARLAAGTMTPEDAADMLVTEAGMDRGSARHEVRRYTLYPTQPMSYLIGRVQIEALERRLREMHGPAFDARKFHDAFLSFGTIPIDLVGQALIDHPPLTRRGARAAPPG